MSTPSPVTKLLPPVRDIVLAASKEGENLGKTEKDVEEVSDWISKIAEGSIVKETKELDAQLISRTYLVSNYLTAADIALYGSLHPTFSQLQPAQYYSHPALTRYFDHIQSIPSVRAAADTLSPAFAEVKIDIENMPKLERLPDVPKKKEKKEKAVAGEQAGSPVADVKGAKAAAPSGDKKEGAPVKEKKEKKEKEPKEEKQGAQGEVKENAKQKKASGSATPAEDAGEPVPSMIDLRVGHIVDIKKHPDADGLYVEKIDLGEETGPRTIISGLVNYIPIEEMRDKYLVAICNLKPVAMRGIKSFGMVLCATSKEGKEGGIEVVQPPAGSKPGDRVYFEGEKYENATPLPLLNPKKKIFETIQPGFTTLETKEAAWVDPKTKETHKLRTKLGACVAPTFVGASLS